MSGRYAHAGPSGSAQAAHAWIEPSGVSGDPIPTATSGLTPEELRRLEAALARPRRIVVPVDPTVRPQDIQPTSPPSFPNLAADGGRLGPGCNFAVYQNHILSDVATNNATSVVNEPSLGSNGNVVFWSGNWHASASDTAGQTFSHVDPADNFPADGTDDNVNNGFCCDQIVYFDRSRGAFFWLLQYSEDGNTNTQRIAIANSNDDVVANNWFWYDWAPASFGFPAKGHWLDFPDLSVSDNFLYLTTNVFEIGGEFSTTAVVARFPLDEMSQGMPFTHDYFVTDLGGLRCTHGATTTMYWGAHISTTSIRIYRWAESETTVSWDDVNHAAFNTETNIAPGPDGKDWAGRNDARILGAYRADGVLGFMWGASQGGGFPFPQVQVLRFNEVDRSLLTQSQIWNPDFAWLYPSVAPNDQGNLGGTIAFGGGDTFYPSAAAWIADDCNGDLIVPLESALIAFGDSGPDKNEWGDYLTTRKRTPFGDTWVGSGFVLSGGGANSDVVPHFVAFGRQQDAPSCGDAASGNCCVSNGSSGCDDLTCCYTVCELDPFCCNTTWDGVCAGEAENICSVCALCPWDCDGSDDGAVNVSDLLALLAQWDTNNPPCDGGGACDFDGNGCVEVADLLKLLAHYDPDGVGCPQ